MGVKILSVKKDAVIADKCEVAKHFFSRLRGLLGKTELPLGEGLLLTPCNDIHMWFMKFPIDVVFLNGNFRNGSLCVTSVHRSIPPWRIFPLRDGRANSTLELPVGTIDRFLIEPGDLLQCLS